MQFHIEIEGANFSFAARTNRPADITCLLDLAVDHDSGSGVEDHPAAVKLQYVGDAPEPVAQLTNGAPVPPSRSRRKQEKPAEPQLAQAAPVEPEPAAASPAEPEPVQAAPSAAPEASSPEAIKKLATDTCVAAIGRNREQVQNLLAEFGATRFRDLGDDVDKLLKFQARAAAIPAAA